MSENQNTESTQPAGGETVLMKDGVPTGAAKVKLSKKLLSREAEPQKKRERKLGDFFTGRRKTAVARVKISKGTGKFIINRVDLHQYFRKKLQSQLVMRPLELTQNADKYDILVNVTGGGPSGQAQAISLGLARGLDAVDSKVHKTLRSNGLLTRDSRMVERKKYGLHKARRAPQFSKR